jgi:hypothetical protein
MPWWGLVPLALDAPAEWAVGAWFGQHAAQGETAAQTGATMGLHARVRPQERWGVDARLGRGPAGWELSLDGLRVIGDPSLEVVGLLHAGLGAAGAGDPRVFMSLGAALDIQLRDSLDVHADARVRRSADGHTALLFTVGPLWHPPHAFDADRDGVSDREDRCPDQREDRDGFEDLDGCVDADDDLDGIPDSTDRCRSVAEDRDGFLDQDGCPEPDNDGDGLDDVRDLCLVAPEDIDGWQDQDGCPDPDNDGDTVADDVDGCPQDAEDHDGTSDDDGCPDPDNDGDGVPDARDRAPDAPENRNGWEDDDGAPDVLPRVLARLVGPLPALRFDPGAVPTERATDLLATLADVLASYPGVRVHLHVSAPDPVLAEARADTVRDTLTEAGIAPSRVEVLGSVGEDAASLMLVP